MQAIELIGTIDRHDEQPAVSLCPDEFVRHLRSPVYLSKSRLPLELTAIKGLRNTLSGMIDTLELSEQARLTDEEGFDAPPPPFESVKWRVRIGDTEYGPYPRSRLIDFLKEGRVTAGTHIACGADTDYHRADHHPNLRWDFKASRRRKFGEPRLDPGESEVPVCNYF